MKYVAKIKDFYSMSAYGYGEADHEAVSAAVKNFADLWEGEAPDPDALLTVYTETGDGSVDVRYTMPYRCYLLETK